MFFTIFFLFNGSATNEFTVGPIFFFFFQKKIEKIVLAVNSVLTDPVGLKRFCKKHCLEDVKRNISCVIKISNFNFYQA